jgi:hypothetical protein
MKPLPKIEKLIKELYNKQEVSFYEHIRKFRQMAKIKKHFR